MRRAVRAGGAPAAIGPYSQAVEASGLVFASGQIALDPGSGTLVEGGIEEQTRQVLRNLTAVLEAAGSGPHRVVRTTVYLADMSDFDLMNRVYAQWVPDPPPARVCVEVSRLPRGARVEIDVIALAGAG